MIKKESIMNYMSGLGIHIGDLYINQNSNINKYLLGTRNNYNVIDLKKTILLLKRSCFFLSNIVQNGGILYYYNSLFYTLNWRNFVYFYEQLKKENHFFTFLKPKAGSFSNYKACFVGFLKIFMDMDYRSFKWWRKFRRYSSIKKKIIFLKLFLALIKISNIEFKKNRKDISIICRCLIFLKYSKHIFHIPDLLISLDEEKSSSTPTFDYYAIKSPVLGLSDTGKQIKYLTYYVPSNSSSFIISFFFFSVFKFTAMKARLKRYKYFYSETYGRLGKLNKLGYFLWGLKQKKRFENRKSVNTNSVKQQQRKKK